MYKNSPHRIHQTNQANVEKYEMIFKVAAKFKVQVYAYKDQWMKDQEMKLMIVD